MLKCFANYRCEWNVMILSCLCISLVFWHFLNIYLSFSVSAPVLFFWGGGHPEVGLPR